MAEIPLIYFICTGNSARSQMAEGFVRHLGDGRFEAASGGLEPSALHPLAIRVMAESGIDITSQWSKPIEDDLFQKAAAVITLCGDADARCPVTPAGVRREHWPLTDPAKATGSPDAQLETFRTVRDQILRRVTLFLQEWSDTAP